MAVQHADVAVAHAGPGMKRRGILAAAGAAVGTVLAGIAARQVSEPVAAATDTNFVATGTGTTNFDAQGNGNYGVNTSFGNFNVGVNGYGTSIGVRAYSPGTGVASKSDGGTGVQGNSGSGTGVYGAGSGPGAVGIHGTANAANGVGCIGESSSFVGVWGQTDSGTAVLGDVKAGAAGASNTAVQGRIGAFPGGNSQANTIAVQGINQSTGANGIGVQGQSTVGLGGSFQGGTAPLRLVPGSQSARTLTATGHQAGEVYVTSDNLLFFFDGTNWREVVLAAPGSGVPPAAVARPSGVNTTSQPVSPLPPPRP
jgi:hypothetical protein